MRTDWHREDGIGNSQVDGDSNASSWAQLDFPFYIINKNLRLLETIHIVQKISNRNVGSRAW
jgi:hypothetical protein